MRNWWRAVVTFSLAVTATTATAAVLSNSGAPAAGDNPPSGDSDIPLGQAHWPYEGDRAGSAPCSPLQSPEECTYGYRPYLDSSWTDPYGGVVTIDGGQGYADPGKTLIVDAGPGRGSPGYNPDPADIPSVDPHPHPCPDDVCHTLAPVWAVEDLVRRLGTTVAAINVISIERVDWPDGSLGDPQPGYAYTDAIVPGYRVTLESNAQRYIYHTDMHGNVKIMSGA